MKVLTVLMWHHMLVRQRRFIVTTIELISPMILFILLFSLRKFFLIASPLSSGAGELKLNIHYTEPMHINNTKPLSLVLYSPSTQLTDILMDAVGKTLGLSRLHSFPDPKSRGYYALDSTSTSAMNQLIEKLKDNCAIVLFSNMDGAEFPPKLNYTIRMNVDFMTYMFKSMDENIGPHERFGTIYEPFMRLQWAIDTSYIKMRTNKNVGREMYLQEIPFVDTGKFPEADIVVPLACACSLWGLMLPYIFLMQRLMLYRQTGIEELIKMVGVTAPMFRLSHFINMLPTCLLYSLSGSILLKASSTPLLPQTNICLIFVTLILHFMTMVLIAFIFSHISESSQYSTTISMLSFMAMVIVARVINDYLLSIPRVFRVMLILTPLTPLLLFWRNVTYLEKNGEGLTFLNMFKVVYEGVCPPFVCYVMFAVQAVLLAGLAWYVALVRPGKYGVALPVGFLCKRSYWIPKVSPSKELAQAEETEPMARDPRLFETVDHHPDIGIKIVDVTKVYGKKKVLSNVTLDVYKGEITVLLGHNGAGKTTLMSIITGMTSMTAGSVFVNGMSLATQTACVRRELGLCPQHNLSMPSLTVLQQVVFFALLKGQSYAKADLTSRKLLEQLGLADKANNLAEQLSGGMKRRLQLACALAGGSTVLILDEPTSGLDVETRRELWDLLLSLRGRHTVLLTTHFMEEADALGDRVAALHGGTLRCYATPMFLKKGIGTGYRLSLTTVGLPNEEAITGMITSIIPNALLKEKSYNSITYTLPSQDSNKFPKLFSTLETKRSELSIESIGVGVSTLEDVFLKLCSDVDTKFTEDTVDITIPETTLITKKGIVYYLLVMGLLIGRQLRYLTHNIFVFIGVQTLIPVALMVLFTFAVCIRDDSNDNSSSSSRQAMDLDMYRSMKGKRVVHQGLGPDSLRTLAPKYSDVEFETTQDDVATNILNNTIARSTDYSEYIAGIELNGTHAKVLYTTAVRHAAPVALNVLTNMLATQTAPGTSIVTYNDPLTNITNVVPLQPVDKPSLTFWVIMLSCIYLGTLTSAPALALTERRLGTRHLHMMAGCPPALHWLATFVSHLLAYGVFLLVPMLLITLIDKSGTINEPAFIGLLSVILLLGTMAGLAQAYLVHFITDAVGLLLTVIIMGFGILPATILTFWKLANMNTSKLVTGLSWFLNVVSPAYAMTAALLFSVDIAHDNAFCNNNIHLCPLPLNEKFAKCCENGKNPHCYLCTGELTPMKDIIIMIVQTISYMALVVLAEYGLFGQLWDKLVNSTYKNPEHAFSDAMVLAEKTYVDKAIALPKKQIPDALLASDLHKNYFRCRHPCTPFKAVKGLSFSVKKGECFGLLGVNGAGKSTTFKMITAEVAATRGRCFANSHYLQWPRTPYLRSLGYCPQFFGMDEFLTGRENLRLLLTLRGLQTADILREVEAWIAVAGLEQYANVRVGAYSGGCARRLAATAALASGAPVTLLDEPTAGVDVAARRRVWLAVRRGLRDRRAVVLTSHSMDEMEALCDRIAIMAGGELAALGSAPALRAAHASGHAVALKVRSVARAVTASAASTTNAAATSAPAADATDGPDPLLPLKQAVNNKFTCRLTDEHKTMLHYHVHESVRYSELFTCLEELKQAFPDLIEDYSVSETTLEEVFLSFAQPSGGKAIGTSPA